MIEIVRELAAVRRGVGTAQMPTGEGHVVRLRRTYAAPIDDVWDAVTNPRRISRWFLPISGDMRLGGSYQLEGNAGGRILECDQPNRFRVSWIYGEMGDEAGASILEVFLTPAAGDATELVLEHSGVVPDEVWAQYGPGALGVGWDGGLLGLALHLRGESVGDPIAWQLSAEGREFSTRSSEAWGEANRAFGADANAAAQAVANTTAFYAPEPETAAAEAADRPGA
jgi:uncharacterized protein YndB with AHSA1/START domain